ncbi:MAG: C1 family peptidase [Bacteroidia bacterium]|nr:C1 family peptidase [Bacteroidia bacterium]
MPVRITKDQPSSSGGRGGGGKGPGAGLIIALLMLVFRYPKVGIPLLIIGGLAWFYFSSGPSSTASADGPTVVGDYGLGAQLDREEFNQALVYEPLVPGALPAQVSLLKYSPAPGDQGQQGSCTAWATAYAARTIQASVETGQKPNDIALSPAFLYNQLTRGSCGGTSIRKALDLVRQRGLVELDDFPYDDSDCSTQPGPAELQQAQQYRIAGYNRLTLNHDDYAVDINAVKQNLAQGAPVVIGMLVGGSFYDVRGPGASWRPTRADLQAMEASANGNIVNDGDASQFGGHAMCVVGYDDSKDGGSFHIQNSWGEQWGDKGTFWMRYADFQQFTNTLGAEVYGLYPTAPREAPKDVAFAAQVGLLNNATQKLIPVTSQGGGLYATGGTLPVGTRFKISVANTVPCYTYVFGRDTDATSYVLFPYTEQHSPYCGIVGQRVFPKSESLELDDKGTTDYMAILITRKEVDFAAINRRVSASRAGSYAEQLREGLRGAVTLAEVPFVGGDAVQFTVPKDNPADAVLVVFGIRKGQ